MVLVTALVRKARAGTLEIPDFEGTTVSLTNPGTIGTVSSNPRLMAGQSAIIATGAIEYPAEYQAMVTRLENEGPFSVVLTDYNMPRMNGLQLLTILKGDPALSAIPAFILTTALTPNQTHELKSLGAHGYLIKPSSYDEFKNLLRTNLKKYFGISS